MCRLVVPGPSDLSLKIVADTSLTSRTILTMYRSTASICPVMSNDASIAAVASEEREKTTSYQYFQHLNSDKNPLSIVLQILLWRETSRV